MNSSNLTSFPWVCITCETNLSFSPCFAIFFLLSHRFRMTYPTVLRSLSQRTPLLLWGGCRQPRATATATLLPAASVCQ